MSESRSEELKHLALVGHEMRAPLAGIRGAAGLLLRDGLTEAQEELLHQICTSADVLSQLVNDTLDLARLQSGKTSLHPVVVDLSALMDEVVAQLVAAQSTSTLDVVVHYPADTTRYVQIDGLRLRQVLTNLVGNALKFTQAGQVDFSALGSRVDTDESGVPQAEVMFTVRDTGIGIPQERLEAIFQPFEQATDAISTHFGGTGLGLSIARRLVAQMGGTLRVASVEGEGAEFTFVLTAPLVAEPSVEASRARRISRNRHAPRSRRHGMADASKQWKQTLQSATLGRVLVADDDQISRLVARAGLAELGLGAELACNGCEAVELANRLPFELALVDLQMPGMNGYELIRHLRAQPNPPVLIALTAARAADVEREAREAGADGVLAKPFETDDLAVLLDSLRPAWWRTATAQYRA